MSTSPKFFSRLDWRSFWITTIASFAVYLWTLAPNVGLEDSGEFLTAAYHWGVPHPPGYPVWALSANIFEILIPFGNAAWRVNLMSAFYGALAAGMLTLTTTKVAAQLWEIERLKSFSVPGVSRSAVIQAVGIISGLIFALTDTLWSQAVIAEVYTLNGFFFTGSCLVVLRWLDSPQQKRWPCLLALTFGLGITNHQTLLVSALAFLYALYAGNRALGRHTTFFAAIATAVFAWQSGLWFMWLVVGLLLFVFAYSSVERTTLVTLRDLCVLIVSFGLAISIVAEWWMFTVIWLVFYVGYVFLNPQLWNARNVFMWVLALLFGSLLITAFIKLGGGDIAIVKNWIFKEGIARSDLMRGWLFVDIVLLILWVGIVVSDLLKEDSALKVGLPLALAFLPVVIFEVIAWKTHSFVFVVAALLAFVFYGVWLFVRRRGHYLLNSFTLFNGLLWSLAVLAIVGKLFTGDENQNVEFLKIVGGLAAIIILTVIWVILLLYPQFSNGSTLRHATPFLLSIYLFGIGSSLYLYMPLASLTNPPMNWGYTGTPEGFQHHITRGQYERIKTNRESFDQVVQQYIGFFKDLEENFSLPFVLIGILALVSIFLFATSRTKLMGIAENGSWGWLRLGAYLFRGPDIPKKIRSYLVFTILCFIFMGPVLVWLMNPKFDRQHLFIIRVFYSLAHGVFSLWIGLGTIFLLYWVSQLNKSRFCKIVPFFALFITCIAVVVWKLDWPSQSQWLWLTGAAVGIFALSSLLLRGRGMAVLAMVYAFPFIPLTMNWELSEMRGHDFGWRYGHDMLVDLDRDAVVYGGTDPGRFVPTYMIFVESFQPERWRRNPKFDRRDLYIITQNALADQTYMNYIRDHYDVKRPAMDQWYHRLLGRDKLYPREPLIIPGDEEFNAIFNQVVMDAQGKPNSGIRFKEDPSGQGGLRATVEGIEGVFAINAGIAQWIFEKNKAKHSFYVEESYPLAWMYPYLEPVGLIMKVNKEPLRELDPKIVKKDMVYWASIRADLMSDPAFCRDEVARKSYSKLRNSIGGLYTYRNMVREAEQAFREAIEFYPASSESRAHLAEMMASQGRFEEARESTREWLKLDPLNPTPRMVLKQIDALQELVEKEAEMASVYHVSKNDPNFIFSYATVLKDRAKLADSDKVIDVFLGDRPSDLNLWQIAIQFYRQNNRSDRMEFLLQRVSELNPRNPVLWFNLAAIQSEMSKVTEAVASLKRAIDLDKNYREAAKTEAHFNRIRNDEKFQQLIGP
jgi:tetratricopeptide (TPR) repeat protein